jgi:hypothetical protein
VIDACAGRLPGQHKSSSRFRCDHQRPQHAAL